MRTRSLVAIVVTSSLFLACGGSAETAPPPRVEAAPVVPPVDVEAMMKQPDLPPQNDDAAPTHPASHTIGQNNPDQVIDSETHGGSSNQKSNATATTNGTPAATPHLRGGGGGMSGGGRGGGGRGGSRGGGGSSGGGSTTTTTTSPTYGPATMQ